MPDERLASARGSVRDGAAGIESFAHLLGSRRVGPRGVALALPEVREGCTTLSSALDRLAEAIHAGFDGSDERAAEVAGAAIAHASAEVARLAQDLSCSGAVASPGGRSGARGSGVRGTVDAKQRLALEASVRRATRELDGALYLADLVIATIELRPTSLALIDVLREWSSSAEGQPLVKITAAPGDDRGDELEGDVRVLGGLVELAVGLVTAAGVTAPHLAASRRADGRSELRVGPRPPRDPPKSLALDLALRDGGERAAAVAHVVARRARIELTVEGDGRVVTMAI